MKTNGGHVMASTKTDKGNVLFNLSIEIGSDEKRFADGIFGRAVDQIEKLGLAINWAKNMLAGEWHVLSDGTLVRGHADRLESECASIDVSENMLPIKLISEIMEKQGEPSEYGIFAHNIADYIKHDGKKFYIGSIRWAHEIVARSNKLWE